MPSNLADPFPALVKITDLTAGTTVTGTEILEAVQGDGSVRLTISQIFNGMLGSHAAFLSGSRLAAVPLSLTTDVATTVVSLALPPGDWDLFPVVGFTGSPTTVAGYMAASLSNVSTSLNTTVGEAVSIPCFNLAVFTTTVPTTFPAPTVRRSILATTTYYLTAQMGFSTSTAGVYGSLAAREASQ